MVKFLPIFIIYYKVNNMNTINYKVRFYNSKSKAEGPEFIVLLMTCNMNIHREHLQGSRNGFHVLSICRAYVH